MENLKPSGSESGCGRLYTEEVVVQGSNCKALTGKILVLWIDGRLWETVTYGRRSLTRASRTWRFDLYPVLQLLIPPIMQFFSALELIEGF